MEAVFLKIVNMSITAGWAALAVMAARLLFRKAPRGLLCCLWAVVALRLMLPFSFESVISLVPSTETLPQAFLFAASPQIDSGIPALNTVVNPVVSQSLTPHPVASANPTQIWSFVFAWLWVFGMAAMGLYTLISYLRIRRRVRASILLEDGVYVCDGIDTPFILGFVKPKIYIPGAMDEKTLGHVLAHERSHIHRFDHLWKPLGFLLLAVHWFNPILWVAYILLCRDIELACDERVIRDLDTDGKKAYSHALLRCSVRRPMIAACPLAFGEVGVKQRIQSVLRYKKPTLWVVVIAILVCTILAVCFLTDPIPASVFDILEGRGYTVLANCPQAIELSVPSGRFADEAFTHEGQHFMEKEIVVYQTDTTAIWLSGVMLSNESDEQLYFTFDISYDLPAVGTVLTAQNSIFNSYFGLNSKSVTGCSVIYQDTVSLRGTGPEQAFSFYVDSDIARKDGGWLGFSVTMNQITYAKAGHAPKLHRGGTNLDQNYFHWTFSDEHDYEVRLNDLGLFAFSQPYQEFEAMTVQYADAIAYLMDKYNLDPIDPFHYEGYMKYGILSQDPNVEMEQACLAVSQILNIYENSFKTEADAADTPITQARIPDGVYHSGEAAFWNPLSSVYYPGSGITVVVENSTIQIDGGKPVPVSLYWQDQCPMSDQILEEFHEYYSGLGMLPFTLDDECQYQLIDQNYFLLRRDSRIYLVSRWAQDKGLNAIWYIVELHRE